MQGLRNGLRIWQKRGGKGSKRGGRKVGIAYLPENFNELSRKSLLEDFGHLEDDIRASFVEFRENVMGTGLLESGFC